MHDKTLPLLVSTLLCLAPALFGCQHRMELMNAPPVSLAVPDLGRPMEVGLVNRSQSPEVDGYITAVARSLEKNGSIRKVVYPCLPEREVDAVAYIEVDPLYRGVGSNFWVDWPGFLVFAPAWHGYSYHADVRTRVEVVSKREPRRSGSFEWRHDYEFRQADEGRTWVELGWLEWGVTPFIGGLLAKRYDTDQTPHFILEAEPSYGSQVAGRIVKQLAGEQPSGGAERQGGEARHPQSSGAE